MRNLFLLTLLVFQSVATLLAQPVTYTPAQIERVAKLSELYGHIKFFHPYLGYKPINWDSAFVVAAPLVANARTDTETITAIRQLLTVLGDDVTTVQLTTKPTATTGSTSTSADSMRVYFTADSILVLKTNNYAGISDYDIPVDLFNSFISQLPRARAALLDLRGGRVLSQEEKDYFRATLSYVELERVLVAEPYSTPGMRLRNHSGYATEGGGSNMYWSGFYTLSGQTIQPRRGIKSRPLAVLVNKQAALTPALFALRNRPHVQFLMTDTLSEAQLVNTVSFPFSDVITVRFRTGELVNADGSLGLSDVPLIPIAIKPEATEAYVLDRLRNPDHSTPTAHSAPTPASLPITPPAITYTPDKYPTLGYRLLAGAKIWSVIHYFHAYKDLIPTDWNASLRTAIGELAAVSDSTQYALAVAHFYRNIQDGHGFISASALYHYAGSGGVPIAIRFLENKPVVTRIFADSVAAKGIRVGDILLEVNGETIETRIKRMSAIQPASNEWTRLHYLSYRLLRGPVRSPLRIKLLGADGRQKTVTLTSLPASQLQPPADTSAMFRLLTGNIGYVNMEKLQTKDVDRMFETFKATKAIIFDMRNYPQGTAWAIAPRLTDKRNVVGAKYFRYAPNEPEIATGELVSATQKYYFDQQLAPNTGEPVYRGKTVMLIDERTQSQAEHSGLFFEAANGTEFIGSPTAGANGDITNFRVPGGINLTFSGHDIRHADGRQLQQIGLQPRILVRPTINGIRAGRDEVLERAVQYLNTGK